MKPTPDVGCVIRRYGRRRISLRLFVFFLLPSWFVLLGFSSLLSTMPTWDHLLAGYGISQGSIGILIIGVFVTGLLCVLYGNSCPICATSFFRGNKQRIRTIMDVSGYCDSCQERFDINSFLLKQGLDSPATRQKNEFSTLS